MTTAKQRAWRAKFAQLYGGKRKARTYRTPSGLRVRMRSGMKGFRSTAGRRKVVTMAKRKGYRHRSGGMGGMLKPILFGAIASELAMKVPSVVPMQNTAGAAVGGYLAKKSAMGAVLGVVGGIAKDALIHGSSPLSSGGVVLH